MQGETGATVEHPADKPPRTLRPMLAWTAGIMVALALAGTVGGLLIVPFLQARDALWARTASGSFQDSDVTIERLGGPAAAARKLSLLVKMPAWMYIRGRGSLSKSQEAAALRKQAIPLLAACGRPGAIELAGLLGHRDAATRRSAAAALTLAGGDAAWAAGALLQALADADPDVRMIAAASAGNLGLNSASFQEALVRALADSAPLVRAQAAWALGRMGTEGNPAVPALERALADPDADVHVEAITALYRIAGDAGKFRARLTALVGAKDRERAREAVSRLKLLSTAEGETARLLTTLLKTAQAENPQPQPESPEEAYQSALTWALEKLQKPDDRRITPEMAWRLERRVCFDFTEVSLREALMTAGRAADIPVENDPAAGTVLVTMRVRLISVDSMLSWVLRMGRMEWTVREGRIVPVKPN